MRHARALLRSAVFAALTLGSLAALAKGEAARTGLDPDRLARIDAMVQGYIDAKQIPGAVTLVARRGEIAHVTVQGDKAFGSSDPMRRDTLFRVYSMSKPITSVAVLMLYEEGKLRLTDPVSKWIPELAKPRILRDPKGPIDVTDPSPAEITVRDLLTHCSGLVYSFTTGEVLGKAYEAAGVSGAGSPLTPSEWAARLGKLPLAHAPGTKWNYSVSTDVLGLLVERVSGMPFPQFLEQRLFAPLGMKDTAFYVPAGKLGRLATNYMPNAQGGLDVFDAPATSTYRTQPALPSGGGGLVSTADDYARFALMLAGHGKLGDARILSRKTVELMATNHLNASEQETFGLRGYRVFAGNGFGLGVMVQTEEAGTRGLGSVGKNGWGGAAGTWYWVDPEEDLVAVLMIQRMSFGGPPIAISRDFETAVYQAIAD
ncbi:MAG: serine hydrolase domain-containing protein [Myxococcota bacterium]|jgi:CubicO group peptidase (beta-lactamase class C family)